ncbi:restriction endonuclease subunit S [Streptococcus suis]
MPNKDKNIPKRRFKAFENADAWELRNVGEICRISTGKSNTQDREEQGKFPFYVRSPIIEKSTKYLFDEEAVLTVGDGVGTGKVFHYVHGKYDLHQRVYRMFSFTHVNAKYFYYYFSKKFFDRVMAMTAKNSVDSVRLEMISDMEITIPQLEEQEKIVKILSTLDQQITLHQRKLDKLKSVKQAYLSEMFPTEGERVPKRRFPGFTDDWELRKLGEVADIIGGGTPSTSNSEFWDGDIDWYTPAEIGEQIYVDGSERKITQLGLDKSSATVLPANKTILFTSRAGIGKTAILRSDATTNQGFQSIVVDNNTEPYFIFSMTDKIKNKAISVASGSTFAEISSRALGQLEFMFPSINEQEAIGTFFSTLDSQITLHQRKLEKLKNLKKALLNELFV